MKYTSLDLGTIEAVFNKIGGIEGAKAFLRGDKIIATPVTLRLIGWPSVGPLAEPFDPKKFFKNRKGLYVCGSFLNCVLPRAEKSEPTSAISLNIFGLLRGACDREIKAELPKQHEIDLWEIAKLIEGQSNGEDGPLNNREGNIFYVSGFRVYMMWSSTLCWSIVGGPIGPDEYWSIGTRVFSRN